MLEVNGNILTIGSKTIELEHSVKKVLKYNDAVVVLIYDNTIISNNVIAFNYEGKQLWKINDIINVKKPTGNVDIKKEAENILSVYSDLSILFEIDINKRELVNKIYLR